MKAFFLDSARTFRFGELADPSPAAGEQLIEVKASSLNPVDWKLSRGAFRFLTGPSLPRVFGTDFAGVVRSTGRRVYGAISLLGHWGAHAELAAVAEDSLRSMPEWMDFETAAALPVAGLTALNGLRLAGELQGRRVLVIGATGGVGHFAVQLARARGAHVTAVCGTRNVELARQLGANEVIDYSREDVTASKQRWDVFFDAAGHSSYSAASRVLQKGGVFLSTLPHPSVALDTVRGLISGKRFALANLRKHPEDFQELESLVQSGAVKPLIEKRFPLERAEEAYRESESGHARGKLILTVP